MKEIRPIWKKTAAATLAFTMLAGGATGALASADSKKDKDWKKSSWDNRGNKNDKKEDKKKDKKDDKSNQRNGNFQFGDLNEKEWKWAYQHIMRLASMGVFNGYADGRFKPRNNITRIEALVAAVRLLGLQEEAEKPENRNATLNFKDFDQLKKKYGWAVGYVAVALENDLFFETDDKIQPNKPADRLWASVLLVKALKLEDEAKKKMDTALPFRDAKNIPAGSVGYVAVALERNLITGYGDNTFQPNKPVTRAELAALLDRAGQQLPGEIDNQALNGTIQSVANGSLVLKKQDGTMVILPVADNVFIFRQNVKSPLSALREGDEALVRTYQGKAVFVEVTRTAAENVQFADSGKVISFILNAEGKVATISLSKEVNGTVQLTLYNVDPNVTIAGNAGVLSPNLNVVVKGNNNVVHTIEILP
ncbi:S-layer homology domain-containing protein [Paenibacillaceae bacterium WGS1546]|uniref:S-layer homology domain-containing protein n=1 Tax=Cohnella sp. WGS1546 TaxID=3366810 RepID=UPI00372D87D8